MNRIIKNLFVPPLALCLWPFVSKGQPANVLPAWAFGGFVRPANLNPIISPDSSATFIDPMTGKSVAWESDNTFNPGAIIKNGKVIVLYRAEDHSGMGIGFHTSRIGYAESSDGLHFKTKRTPVLFPADDSQKEFEWPGGL